MTRVAGVNYAALELQPLAVTKARKEGREGMGRVSLNCAPFLSHRKLAAMQFRAGFITFPVYNVVFHFLFGRRLVVLFPLIKQFRFYDRPDWGRMSYCTIKPIHVIYSTGNNFLYFQSCILAVGGTETRLVPDEDSPKG